MSGILEQISTAVIEGDMDEIQDLTEDALDDGLKAEEILNKGLMPGMDYVGVEFRAGNMFVPEVLRSAKTMQGSMNILKPLLLGRGLRRADVTHIEGQRIGQQVFDRRQILRHGGGRDRGPFPRAAGHCRLPGG